MRIMMLDDEQNALDTIAYLLNECTSHEIVYASTDAVQALEDLKRLDVDTLFLDIDIPIISGLDFCERAQELKPGIKIVFVTAHERYAVEAFRINAVDYMLKPVTRTRLMRTIARLESMPEKAAAPAPKKTQEAAKPPVVLGTKGGKYYIIHFEEALYLVVEQRNVYVVMPDSRYRLQHNIAHWEGVLPASEWLRSHRAYLIHLPKVEAINKLSNSVYSVKMVRHSEEIPISRSYIADFKRHLGLV